MFEKISLTQVVSTLTITGFLSSHAMAELAMPDIFEQTPVIPEEAKSPTSEQSLQATALEQCLKTNRVTSTCHSAWATGFIGKKVKSDNVGNNTPGYDLWSGGGMMGIERQLCPGTRRAQIGFAVRYDNADLNGNLLYERPEELVIDLPAIPAVYERGSDLNFDSMRAIVYGRFFKNQTYLSLMGSYAFNQYFEYQRLAAGYPHPRIFGDYDANQWGAELKVGHEWKWCPCDVEITPEFSLYYSNLSAQGYKRITADVLNNQEITYIDGLSDNALFAGFDLNLAYVNHYPKAKVIPYVHANIKYQALEDSMQHFVHLDVLGGGLSYVYPNDIPGQTYYGLGAGIKVVGDHNIFVLMSYDYRFRPGEYSHALLLSIKQDW